MVSKVVHVVMFAEQLPPDWHTSVRLYAEPTSFEATGLGINLNLDTGETHRRVKLESTFT